MSYDRSLLGGLIAVVLLAGATCCHAQSDNKPPAEVAAKAEDETLKERLSDKASDEQRVDNCKVPIDKRGPKPRPDCPGLLSQPSGQTAQPQPLGQMSTK